MSALEFAALFTGPDAYKRVFLMITIACILLIIYIVNSSNDDDFI
jgi:hypothetical protein